jgi:hypothetical protein
VAQAVLSKWGRIAVALGAISAGAPAVAEVVCQSASLCLHSNMPLYNQGAVSLISLINKNKGLALKQDMGFCGPTASAMVLKSMRNNSPIPLLSMVDIEKPEELIFAVGESEGINWEKGGVQISGAKSIRSTVRDLFTKSIIHSGNGYSGRVPTVAEFRNYVPIYVVGAQGKTAAHAMALNGVEGNLHKIFDPWGRIYSVKASATGDTLSNPSGFGFVSSYGQNVAKEVRVLSTEGGERIPDVAVVNGKIQFVRNPASLNSFCDPSKVNPLLKASAIARGGSCKPVSVVNSR